ncbi:ionotropic receptor 75a [Drosophila elegans]|uniref:ionotropic receptor 75a n=1 Tax=Drosophila elegans TaxID=30023 RepID=UPI001BC86728|nr:ionotropic receptor 75a [Drosophila elegans]
MTALPLYRLVVFHLLEVNLSNLMVFYCWSLEEAFPLAKMLNENGIYSQYIDLQQDPENLANIHKDYLDSDLVRLGVFLDMGCDQAEFITNQSSRARLFNHNLHWLLYDEEGNLTKLTQQFEGANLSLNADVTYVSREEEDVFTLYDVYNKGSHLGGKLNITIDQSLQCNQSRCQVKDYLSDLHLRTRLQHRLDLSSVTFRLAAVVSALPIDSSEEALLEFLNSDRDSHMDSFSRIGYRLILHTQELLGFKLHYIWLDTWSVQDAYGGAIGMLTNESAELCTSPFVPSWKRLHYVHLMTEQSQFRAVCMFRTPHNAGIKAAVFLEPFMPSVWFAFAALLIFAGVLLWLIFILERHWMQRCLDFIPSLLSSCLISFGAACIQGSYLMPKSAGGRLAFIAVMLTSFLMYNYYTSIVVSTLLGSPVRSNIRTIQQLADSSLDVGFDKVPFTKTYLVSSPRPDIRSLYKQKVESRRDPNSVWLSPEVGVIKVRDQPGFVYTSEASFMYHFVEKHYLPREISDLNEIKLRPESAVYGIVHLNSTYRQLLTQLQVRMLETGIISKQSRFFSKTKLETFSNSFVIQVGMEYAAPLFISLLVAYFLGLLILILELGWARIVKKKLATILPRNQ